MLSCSLDNDDDATPAAVLSDIEVQLQHIDTELTKLRREQATLRAKRDSILQHLNEEEQQRLLGLEPDWSCASSFPWSEGLSQVARDKFGFSQLRPGQLEVMNASMSHYDVLSVMKTGGGKSLCYQLPALLLKSGFTLVVCPLLALIRDQVSAINKIQAGSASSLAGVMERSEQNDVYKAMAAVQTVTESEDGKSAVASGLRLLYATPEKIVKSKLLMTHLQRAYERGHLNCIVIDEAHCASQWGHDFRPDYAKLRVLRTVFPTVPFMLLTATANAVVRGDLAEMLQLGTGGRGGDRVSLGNTSASALQQQEMYLDGTHTIKGFKTFLGDFDRPNLEFEVWRKPSQFASTIALIKNALPAPGSGNAIIYCFSQKECMSVSSALSDLGVSAAPYHAGLSDEYRDNCQDAWVGGTLQVICATIAFGLGINMPSVRLVLHFTLSKSLELYYQEVSQVKRRHRH